MDGVDIQGPSFSRRGKAILIAFTPGGVGRAPFRRKRSHMLSSDPRGVDLIGRSDPGCQQKNRSSTVRFVSIVIGPAVKPRRTKAFSISDRSIGATRELSEPSAPNGDSCINTTEPGREENCSNS